MVSSSNLAKILKEYGLITIGICCYALAWVIFLLPNNFVGGGVTGVSSILQYATKGHIQAGNTYFVINILLIILGLSYLGKDFAFKTVYATILASVTLNFGASIIPAGFIQALALDNGKLMCVIMGGMLGGFGIGLAMSQGGSSGGTDIVALILNKKYGMTPGKIILWIDAGIIASSLLVPSFRPDGSLMPFLDKIMVVVYGYLLVAILAFTLDWTLSGSKQSVQIFITSKKYDLIADEITGQLHRGVTVLNGKGWYTKEESHVLMVLTRKVDSTQLIHKVKTIDPDAFVSISYVSGVYGRGFEQFKAPPKGRGLGAAKNKTTR